MVFKIGTAIIILIGLLISCKDEKQLKNVELSSDKILEQVITKQLEGGNSTEYPIYEYSETDLNVTLPILKMELQKNNFKFLENELFNDKIKTVFGRTIDGKSSNPYLYINFFEKCNREFVYQLNDGFDYLGLFIIKNQNFISELHALPQIIDYQNQFPDIAKIEEKPIEIYDNTANENLQIYHWKDDQKLTEKRQNNIQVLINRNKYLFNDSKASLAWLKGNDIFFLENLVKTFGYYEDKDVTQFVMERSLKNEDEFGKVIWNLDCNNNVKVNLEFFEIIKTLPKDKQDQYFQYLTLYFEYVLIDSGVRKKANLNLTQSQKAEMLGKLAYYGTKATGTDGLYYYTFFKFLNTEEFTKEFEKNNYYNLNGFKSLFEDTKTGGVGLPE